MNYAIVAYASEWDRRCARLVELVGLLIGEPLAALISEQIPASLPVSRIGNNEYVLFCLEVNDNSAFYHELCGLVEFWIGEGRAAGAMVKIREGYDYSPSLPFRPVTIDAECSWREPTGPFFDAAHAREQETDQRTIDLQYLALDLEMFESPDPEPAQTNALFQQVALYIPQNRDEATDRERNCLLLATALVRSRTHLDWDRGSPLASKSCHCCGGLGLEAILASNTFRPRIKQELERVGICLCCYTTVKFLVSHQAELLPDSN